MPSIFISYRREDAAGHAGHLAADLSSRYGRESVFIDIDAIAPGVDFERRIHEALDSCQVTLVLIGDEWLTAEADGKRRIEQEGDYVRTEISAALLRDDVTVIPVLIEDAHMPSAGELPSDLDPIAKINAFELSNKRWRYDLDRLCEVINRSDSWWRRLLRTSPRWAKRGGPVLALGAAAVVAALLLTGRGSTGSQSPPKGPEGELTDSSAGAVKQGMSRDQVEARFGPPDRIDRTPGCEFSGAPDTLNWIWDLSRGGFVLNFNTSTQAVSSYSTTSPAFPTTSGNRVGDSFQSVRDSEAAGLTPLTVGAPSTPQNGFWRVKFKPKAELLFDIAGGKVRRISGGYLPPCD